MPARRGFERHWTFLRDVLLFLVGVAGIFHETVIANAERPTLLLVFGACLGLPAFFPLPRRHGQ